MNTPDDRVDLSTLLNAVIGFSRTYYPGQVPKTLTVTFADDAPPVCLPVPAAPVKPVAGPAPRLTERQLDLLGAVEEADAAVLVGKEIAKLAGYEFTPDVRKDLSALVKAGLLLSCNPGYRLANPGGEP